MPVQQVKFDRYSVYSFWNAVHESGRVFLLENVKSAVDSRRLNHMAWRSFCVRVLLSFSGSAPHADLALGARGISSAPERDDGKRVNRQSPTDWGQT